MLFRGRAVRGVGCAAAVIGAWLLAICGYAGPASELKPVSVTPPKDGTATESPAAVVAEQEAGTVLRIKPAEAQKPAPPQLDAAATVPNQTKNAIRVQWSIGADEPPADKAGTATPATQTGSPDKESNATVTSDSARNQIEVLKIMPLGPAKNGRLLAGAREASDENKVDPANQTTTPAPAVPESSTPLAAPRPMLSEYLLPPRRLPTVEAQHVAARLEAPRLARQPASESRENEAPVEEPIPPAPTTTEPAFQSSPTEAGAGEETIAEAERLGEEPVDNRLQFLRADTVLLDPGEWQWDVGLVYLFRHNDIPIVFVDNLGNVIDVAEGQIRSRELFVPLAFRYGLTRRTQLFLDMPVGWANSELSFEGSDEFHNDGGFGDITIGSSYLVSSNDCRDVVFTFGVTTPTGGDPFDAALTFPAASLGEGFWAVSGDVTCIRTYDPIVAFTSIGGRRYFEREFDGAEILPGSEWRLSMGIGLAVSPKVTLSARFAAAYVEETEINGARIPGTIQEPMSVRLAATIAQCDRWFEPFVEFGTNDDANATVFGAIYTY